MLRFTDNIIAQMTRECNLKCPYCYETTNGQWKGKAMNFETFQKAFNLTVYERCILGRKEHGINWHFHGGEVFLIPWEELRTMIEYVESFRKVFPNITWTLQSNGTLITEEMGEFFVKRGRIIGVSWDGFSDTGRMSPERNKKYIENLRHVSAETGVKYQYLMVFSRKNMKTWMEDFMSVRDIFNSVGINLLCANGQNDEDVPSPEEIWEYWYKPVMESYLTCDPIFERDVQISINLAMSDLLFQYDPDEKRKTGCFNRICGYGTNMIAINPDMEVHPCDKFLDYGPYADRIPHETIYDQDFLGLRTLTRAIDHYEKVAKIEKELGCDTCYARSLCPGDCQAYRISYNGERYINPEMCSLYKRAYSWLTDHWMDILPRVECSITVPQVFGINPLILKQLDKSKYKLCINWDRNTVRLEEKNESKPSIL